MTRVQQKVSLLVRSAAILVLGAGLLLASPNLANASTPSTFTPGSLVNDTSGHPLEAHSPGIIKVGATYYMFGEDVSGYTSTTYQFKNINCYSSPDLLNWSFVNAVLTEQASGDLGPGRIVSRPHVLYNTSTSTYVLVAHGENSAYTEGSVLTATSSTVCGNYTYQGKYNPLGHNSRDLGVFQESNGTAYIIYAGDSNSDIRIDELASNYLSVTSNVFTFSQGSREAPTMVKRNGVYYLALSATTGYETNANVYVTATSLSGPWTPERGLAPGSSNTYDTQVVAIIPIQGAAHSSGDLSYVYVGDKWDQNNLADSRYEFLPLGFGAANSMRLDWYASWTLDLTTAAIQGSRTRLVDDQTTGAGQFQYSFSSGWTSCACDTGEFDGTEHYSNTAGASYTLSFTGTGATLYGLKASNDGDFTVSIDGSSTVTTVHTYNAATLRIVPLYNVSGLSYGVHSITATVVGNGYVGADAVAVLGPNLVINDSATGTASNQFNFQSRASWSYENDAAVIGDLGGDEHYSNVASALYQVAFTGTGVRVNSPVGPGDGFASYSIDGGTGTTVDLFSTVFESNYVPFTVSGLSSGPHTLTVTVTGTHNASSTNNYVGADSVEIIP